MYVYRECVCVILRVCRRAYFGTVAGRLIGRSQVVGQRVIVERSCKQLNHFARKASRRRYGLFSCLPLESTPIPNIPSNIPLPMPFPRNQDNTCSMSSTTLRQSRRREMLSSPSPSIQSTCVPCHVQFQLSPSHPARAKVAPLSILCVLNPHSKGPIRLHFPYTRCCVGGIRSAEVVFSWARCSLIRVSWGMVWHLWK